MVELLPAPSSGLGEGGRKQVSGNPFECRHLRGEVNPDVAIDGNPGQLVHPGAVVAGMALDRDVDRNAHAARDTVCPLGVRDLPGKLTAVLIQIVQCLIQRAHRCGRQIECPHDQSLPHV